MLFVLPHTDFTRNCLQFKYWSPPPSDPERKVSVDPDTATASCSASSARLAVTGGLHVGWKSSATGPSVVTWQVVTLHIWTIKSVQ